MRVDVKRIALALRSGFRRSKSEAEERKGANGGVQSVAERRAAESQTEAPDECRFPCHCPGRAGVEWSAAATAGRGAGPASGRQAERSGRWSRRHCGGLCGHQFNVTSVAVALPKGNHRSGGPDKAPNGTNQKAQILRPLAFKTAATGQIRHLTPRVRFVAPTS